VAVFSLEMGKQQLAERLLSARSGVDSQRMRRNMLNGEELARLQETAAELAEAPMYIDDTPGISAMELRAKARRLASQHDLQCIIIDYLQLMSFPGSESRQAEVSAISRSVKALARELRVPVICLSQLNRNPEGRESKRPMLSDLRESGSIEQDADVCMMLHREAYYHNGDQEWAAENAGRENVSEIIIAKQRNGPTGVVEVLFDGKTTRFLNLARGFGE
jgi:replicative DNA helicase